MSVIVVWIRIYVLRPDDGRVLNKKDWYNRMAGDEWAQINGTPMMISHFKNANVTIGRVDCCIYQIDAIYWRYSWITLFIQRFATRKAKSNQKRIVRSVCKATTKDVRPDKGKAFLNKQTYKCYRLGVLHKENNSTRKY